MKVPLLAGVLAALAVLAGPATARAVTAGGAWAEEGGESAGSAGAPRVHLEFDTRVPAEFLRLVEGRIIDDDSLDAWVALPGNAELLRIGRLRGELEPEQLRENLWHSILGHEGRQGSGVGDLASPPPGDLRAMLEALSRSKAAIRERVSKHVSSYLPAGMIDLEAPIRFHLGGTWSGRTHESIFISLSFLHSYEPPWFDAVDALIAHELLHMAHRRVSPLHADAPTAEGVFGVALSQIHAEGIARHVEYQMLDGDYPRGSYGAFVKSSYRRDLGSFGEAFRRLEELRRVCMRMRDIDGCRRLMRRGLGQGGITYAIGHGMASAVESALGRRNLAGTLAAGPEEFFRLYLQAARMLPGFPVPAEGFEEDLRSASVFLEQRRRIWALRRDAMQAHRSGAFDRAAELFGEVLEAQPTSPVDAYNMACALALGGDSEAAMEWLERAVEQGYDNRAHLEADPDLESLRGRDDYRRLLERLGGGPERSPEVPR